MTPSRKLALEREEGTATDPQGAQDGAKGTGHAQRFDVRTQHDAGQLTPRDAFVSKPPWNWRTERTGFALPHDRAHLKSKAPAAKVTPMPCNWAIANRRKTTAQAIWLRRRIQRPSG